MTRSLFAFIAIACTINACAQSNARMDFEKYNPVSTLVVPEHKLTSAKFPFIDVHNHQWNMGAGDIDGLVRDMDKLNMKVMVNLSGGNGRGLKNMTDAVKQKAPN